MELLKENTGVSLPTLGLAKRFSDMTQEKQSNGETHQLDFIEIKDTHASKSITAEAKKTTQIGETMFASYVSKMGLYVTYTNFTLTVIANDFALRK